MSKETPQKIEKPWIVYPYTVQNLAAGIARIVKINPSGSLDMEYVERQRYPTKCLDSDCLERFDSSAEAIDYILKNGFRQNTHEELVEILELNFPEALKQEREQRQAKCTELTRRIDEMEPGYSADDRLIFYFFPFLSISPIKMRT